MKIIIISHLPCTGGTFFTHLLADSLEKSLVVPEFNIYGVIPSATFQPLSPIASLFNYPHTNFEEKLSLWHSQLDLLISQSQELGIKYLILRDHFTSEYVFNKQSGSPSLINYISNSRYRDIAYPIFSHRHPIDSWISLNYSFLQLISKHDVTQEVYAKQSLCGINQWRSSSHRLLELHVDKLHQNINDISLMLAKYLGIKDLILSPVKSGLSSGASGRFFRSPTAIKSRKISLFGVRSLQHDLQMQQLVESAGYSHKDYNYNVGRFNGYLRNIYVPPLRRIFIKYPGTHAIIKKIVSPIDYEIPFI